MTSEMSITESIADHLTRNGMSDQEFSELVGVDQSTVSRWSTGKAVPSDSRASVLATILGVTTDEALLQIGRARKRRTEDRRSRVVSDMSAHGGRSMSSGEEVVDVGERLERVETLLQQVLDAMQGDPE